MSKVVYDIPDNAKEEVHAAMRKEKNTVVKAIVSCVNVFRWSTQRRD